MKVRMGIHLGPCISGLTGIALPIYTLLGEGVDIAKLMESTGEAMKIQVSNEIIRIVLPKLLIISFNNITKFID